MAELAPSDEELAARARTEPAAFATLYQRHETMVRRVVAARTSDRELTSDLTSLVFEKAWTGIRSFGGGSFRAWLLRITQNAVIDERRRRHEAVSLSAVVDLIDRQPTPHEMAERSEEGARLRRAVAALPPGQQVVVRLRLAGLDDAEIARFTGKSPGAVRGLQHRALLSLRAAMPEQE